jgi:hypothetical protein
MKMVMKYKIKPQIKSKFFPEEIEVILADDIDTQSISTCLLRDGLTVIGFGWAIENPKDMYAQEIGYKWAYKRAIRTMISNAARTTMKNFSSALRKEIDTKMRQALYDARRNENGR